MASNTTKSKTTKITATTKAKTQKVDVPEVAVEVSKKNEVKKKKIEFSKIITASAVMIFAGIGLWSIIEYYMLTKLSIETCAGILPDVTLPVTCISVILGAILSYCLYQWGCKNSRNKYGIDANGEPFNIIINKDDE